MNKLTVTTEVYQFDELTEQAKEVAREWWREYTYSNGFAWSEEYINSVKEGLEAFNAELKDYSIDCQNINCSSWTVKNNNDNTDELTWQRLRKWLLNNYYSNFFERKPQGKYTKNEVTKKWNYKRRSRITYTETSCPFTGYCGDEDFMDVFRKFINNPDNSTLEELLNEATEATFRALEADCEHQLTDEYIDEVIEINEYEFTVDGKRY